MIDNGDIVIVRRNNPICAVPNIRKGNQPTDGGNLLMTDEEKKTFVQEEPGAEKYLKRFMGAREFLHNEIRWCLWLVGVPPKDIRILPKVTERIKRVIEFRKSSKALDTRKIAVTPSLFREQNNPDTFLIIPEVSSERRRYIPIGFMMKDVIPSNKIQIIADASLYHFGVLTSLMHMVWMKHTCGRLKSDYDYSAKIVYNNYPWPKAPTDKQIAAVEAAAQGVLDARARFPDSSLADLYDPLTMPPELVRAHQALDKAVDKGYRTAAFTSETERLEYLFGLYNEYTQPLIKAETKKKRRRK